MAGGELKMGDERREVEAGGCAEGQSSEPMTEGSSGPVVGHDSDRVIDDSTNDKDGLTSGSHIRERWETRHYACHPEESLKILSISI